MDEDTEEKDDVVEDTVEDKEEDEADDAESYCCVSADAADDVC